MDFNEDVEGGNFKSTSCPETRCSTPKNTENSKFGKGSTTDLTIQKSTSTFDRISGRVDVLQTWKYGGID